MSAAAAEKVLIM